NWTGNTVSLLTFCGGVNNEDIYLIYKRDILYITAAAGEVLVTTLQGTYRSRESLNSWIKKLDSGDFFRCHRSYIVNIEKIEKISPWFNGAYNLKLKDCRDIIPVSRENMKTLKDIFGI
ncbi:MAG TPA: LytTR family DNA-binding domain-containing protein, partial [Clostridiales bacterium]|nr:LytTR family DNA-binding domain-containing protein [Clostridiales bacterium]HPP35513.1 LytTR family DNA-binding domain-containing protein [Clostridiales bacterium]